MLIHVVIHISLFGFALLFPAISLAELAGTPVKSYNSAFLSWAEFKLGGKAPLPQAPEKLKPERPPHAPLGHIKRMAQVRGLNILSVKHHQKEIILNLDIDHTHSTPLQIGRSARLAANNAPKNIEKITFRPSHYGLEGPQISLFRRDLERALKEHQGSPQEIWHNAVLMANDAYMNSPQGFDTIFHESGYDIKLLFDEEISLVRADQNISSRTSLLGQLRQKDWQLLNLITGTDIRFNLFDNYNEISDALGPRFLPVRSDIDSFTDTFISIDRLFTAWLGQLDKDIYIALSGGLTEEQYFSYGGEILWRPFDLPYAFGVETHLALKRDPDSPLNMGLSGDSLLSGHLKAYYEPFGSYWRFGIRAGRYLAEDIGASVMADYTFKNGARFTLNATYTDQDDFSVFGTESGFDVGARVRFPIDGLSKYIPYGSQARVTTKVVGRDTGQYLDNPVGLYEMTHPVSKRHIIHHWMEIIE